MQGSRRQEDEGGEKRCKESRKKWMHLSEYLTPFAVPQLCSQDLPPSVDLSQLLPPLCSLILIYSCNENSTSEYAALWCLCCFNSRQLQSYTVLHWVNQAWSLPLSLYVSGTICQTRLLTQFGRRVFSDTNKSLPWLSCCLKIWLDGILSVLESLQKYFRSG